MQNGIFSRILVYRVVIFIQESKLFSPILYNMGEIYRDLVIIHKWRKLLIIILDVIY